MNEEVRKFIVDRNNLPKNFPTHRQAPEFWETLGRTVGTFSFLEDILKKAIFALELTRKYSSEEDFKNAYEKWKGNIEATMADTLYKLAVSYHKLTQTHQEFQSDSEKINELVESLKKASQIRNVLCHGTWGIPDSNGKSLPSFTRRDPKGSKEIEIFETQVDINFLEQVRKHVSNLICDVIDSITSKGWKFPGWNNPGKPIF